MGMEQRINYHLNKFPALKKIIKRVYQRSMYTIFPKVKSEGNIVCVSPNDNKEYFFGYYDKSPWDKSGRFMLCMCATDTWSDVSPREPADILLFDLQKSETDPGRIRKLGVTHSWNVQQGCMLQWLGPDYDRKIIYNDFRDGHFCSIILDIFDGSERVLDQPVYTVSADGKNALTLDFTRLYSLRPGYGYYNLPERTKGKALPNETCIWKIDIETGACTSILKYTDFASFRPRPEMLEKNAVHKVNHIMLSPNGSRFMVLYRWFNSQRKYTRLITCNTDGSDMYLLSDDDMVSHCCWKDNEHILAFENKKSEGPGYYLMEDKTEKYVRCWQELSGDGHPSYSPDGVHVVTDSYPDRTRIATLRVMNGKDEADGVVKVLARVFAPFKYDNDTRCDLHPRWNRSSDAICFDSVYEGHRGLYTVKLDHVEVRKCKVAFLMTSAKKSGPVQQMLNIIKYLDREKFEPFLVTLYGEDKKLSQMDKYLVYAQHYHAATGKTDILMGRTGRLKEVLKQIRPDIIHSLGVFPDYVVSRMQRYPQIITLRNYIWDDYPAKFGKIRGMILARLHLYAMLHTTKTVACSESLSRIYKQKQKLNFDFIRNGVDLEQYARPMEGEVAMIRGELNLPLNAFIFVYSGQIIDRKNQRFLLEAFQGAFPKDEVYLLILGDGADYQALRNEFGSIKNIELRGNVDNVERYLQACDAYVSTSKSEGMPNGVLEAMATGLPVILSDIEQHNEIMRVDSGIGYTYKQTDMSDLVRKMKQMVAADHVAMGEAACRVAHRNFSASEMSRQYQELYCRLAKK